MSQDTFSQDYLKIWTEPDAEQRRANIESLFAPEGKMVVSSIGKTFTGVDEIDQHISRVRADVIEDKGMSFSYGQQVDNAEATYLTSLVSNPQGDVVGRGADVVIRDEDGLITAVYMFMGLE